MKSAPIVFVFLLVLGLAAGATGGHAWRGQEIANLETLIRLKDGELTSLTEKMDERLRKVEETLSSQQAATLESVLKANPASVEILSGPDDTTNVSDQLANIFATSGWNVTSGGEIVELPSGWDSAFLLALPDSEEGRALRAAFDAAAIPYDVQNLAEEDIPQVWLKGY